MFLEVEDLAGKNDAAPKGRGAHRVQRQAQCAHSWHESPGGEVKARYHGQHQRHVLSIRHGRRRRGEPAEEVGKLLGEGRPSQNHVAAGRAGGGDKFRLNVRNKSHD